MKNKAQDAAKSVVDKAKEIGGAVMDKAKGFASAAGEKAEGAKSAVGSGLESFAHTLESGGKYLQEQEWKDIAGDFTNLIRRNPLASALIGIGLGYLISRALRS
jgi:ElaB/YqjD/DUF883 family membrane-anchored ribosome-binding protein